MTKKEEILRAKLDLFNHRAFWWVIDDLDACITGEVSVREVVEAVKAIISSQVLEFREKEEEWKQGSLPIE